LTIDRIDTIDTNNNNIITMTSFEDKLQLSFTLPTRIHGEPTYGTLAELTRTLQENAASVPCTLGGARHGYLALIISDEAYAMKSNTPFVVPAPPPLNPDLPTGATAAQITELTRQHAADTRVFNEYRHVELALKKQLLNNVEPLFLRAKKDNVVGFANKTVRELLQHLVDEYGEITGGEWEENMLRMREPWNPETPFKTLIAQFDKGMEYADAARCSFSPSQILMMAERLIFNTGLFHDDIKEWKATPVDTRTWDSFQTFFRQAHRRYRRQKETTQQAGYHAANAMFCLETTEHIANLAHENRSKDEILQTLNKQLLDMRKEMEEMQKKIDRPQQQRNAPSSNGTNTNAMTHHELAMSRFMKMLARPDNGNYCWTHGYILGDDHTSCTCNKKGPGHIDNATRQNPQGGSTRGKKERGL
jgi:hypothetical protein